MTFGFHFERAGLSGEDGPIASDEQHFEGGHAAANLVREMAQNSLDAKRSDCDGPVRMVFELREMPVEAIPGVSGLRRHIDAAVEKYAAADGGDKLVRAARAVRERTCLTLRIGDYGTRGLLGSETLQEGRTPLAALTRSVGTSSGKVTQGGAGSFGIGKAAARMSSELATVLWTSLPEDAGEVVFAGHARLASHTLNGTNYRAEGFYTDLSIPNDFRYQRGRISVPPFEQRTEPGTDTYVLGYRFAADDPQLYAVRQALLDNFLVAIQRGRLVVEGRGLDEDWTLSAETLEDAVLSLEPDAPARQFYRALFDDEPHVADVKGLGRCELYAYVDETMPKKLNTVGMRKQYMRIHEFNHRSIRSKYAAILVCPDDDGNQLLRSLESPTHSSWDGGRAPGGAAAIRRLQAFVREGLQKKVDAHGGEELHIDGLEGLLPQALGGLSAGGGLLVGFGEGVDEESASVQGAECQSVPRVNAAGTRVGAAVRSAGTAGGDEPASKGKDAGGSGSRSSEEVGIEGDGEEGEGTTRIHARDLELRTFKSGPACYTVILRARRDLEGELHLAALNGSGDAEKYELPIASVSCGNAAMDYRGNVVYGVAVRPEEVTRLEIKLHEDAALRMGVVG